ncbi:MAG: dTMP kinase [Alphaproteobacteria bacterium]|nr:dTMP kinase [Alphaproteobacteria bacterium]
MGQRGLFISLEGGEGAGKTTQLMLLADALRGRGLDVVTTREPGGTPAAESLRETFISHQGQSWPISAQLLTMFAARALHVEQVIKPALAKGKIVICDRFTDSTRAYQGYAQGFDLDSIETLRHIAIGDFEPDITFIFDIDPVTGLSRTSKRVSTGDTFEGLDIGFHQKLRAGFWDIAKQAPDRCHVVDASKKPDIVAQEILNLTLSRLKEHASC